MTPCKSIYLSNRENIKELDPKGEEEMKKDMIERIQGLIKKGVIDPKLKELNSFVIS